MIAITQKTTLRHFDNDFSIKRTDESVLIGASGQGLSSFVNQRIQASKNRLTNRKKIPVVDKKCDKFIRFTFVSNLINLLPILRFYSISM